VVSITGPRQAGKTTLCRATFPDLSYASLEAPDIRAFATEDPRGFLAQYPDGALLDEIQRAPDLPSYLQTLVDDDPRPGRWVLTGSVNHRIAATLAQSLAGRVGLLELLPPSLAELKQFPSAPRTLDAVLLQGAYPRIHDRGIPAEQWLSDYVATYVERDVRQLLNVSDLDRFALFLRLVAGSTSTAVQLTRLGADTGIVQNTVRAWLTVLEASYLIMRVPAWHGSVRKQVARTPKLHLLDSGLACHLLGIRSEEQLRLHPLRGAIFESWVAAELRKQAVHAGRRPALFHFRDASGLEVDLVEELDDALRLIEVKSGATIAADFTGPLEQLCASVEAKQPRTPVRPVLVYGGSQRQSRRRVECVPWDAVDGLQDG
jgi:uncharacterized protein